MENLPEANIDETLSATSGVFGFIQTFFVVVGVVILLIVVFRVAKQFAKGDMSGVAKTAIGGLVAAVLCFNLNLPITLISSLGNLAETVFTSIGNLGGGQQE